MTFQKNLASVCHEQDYYVVIKLRPIILLVQHYDSGIFPRLSAARFTLPYGDHNDLNRFW